MMTVKEYFDAWKNFDYWTQMSDDHRVYLRGQSAKSKLRALAGDDPILNEICDKHLRYDGSLGQSIKPKLEDYMEGEG